MDTRRVLIDTQVGLTTWLRLMSRMENDIGNPNGFGGISLEGKMDFFTALIRFDLKNSASLPDDIREKLWEVRRPQDLNADTLAWIYGAMHYDHEKQLHSTLGASNQMDSIRALVSQSARDEGFANPTKYTMHEKAGLGQKTLATVRDRQQPVMDDKTKDMMREIASKYKIPKMDEEPAEDDAVEEGYAGETIDTPDIDMSDVEKEYDVGDEPDEPPTEHESHEE